LEKCRQILEDLGKDLPNRLFEFDQYFEDLKICCKNARYMEITQLRSLEDELQAPLLEDFAWSLTEDAIAEEGACAVWYIMCRVVEEFREAK